MRKLEVFDGSAARSLRVYHANDRSRDLKPLAEPQRWQAIVRAFLKDDDLRGGTLGFERINALRMRREGDRLEFVNPLRGDFDVEPIHYYLNTGTIVVSGSDWQTIRDEVQEGGIKRHTVTSAIAGNDEEDHFKFYYDHGDRVSIPLMTFMETTFKKPPTRLRLDRLQFQRDGKWVTRDRSPEFRKQAHHLESWLGYYRAQVNASTTGMPWAERTFREMLDQDIPRPETPGLLRMVFGEEALRILQEHTEDIIHS